MSNTKGTENQKQDKNALKALLPVLLLAAVFGSVLGVCSVWFIDGTENIGQIMSELLGMYAPAILLVINTVFAVIFAVVLFQCRGRYARWDGENEEEMDGIEQCLSAGIIGTSVNMILSFFLFGAGIHGVFRNDMGNEDALSDMLLVLAGFIYSMIITIVFQSKMINLEKEMNPEKQGSVYDMKFQKVWLESCDEAERQTIYQSAYKAYQTTNKACLILWLVCVLGMMWWDFGMMPLFVVSALWMILMVSYSMESMRLSKRIK